MNQARSANRRSSSHPQVHQLDTYGSSIDMGRVDSWRIGAVRLPHQATAPCMSSFHKLTTVPVILRPLLTFWLTSRKLILNARGYLWLAAAAGVVGATACAGVK